MSKNKVRHSGRVGMTLEDMAHVIWQAMMVARPKGDTKESSYDEAAEIFGEVFLAANLALTADPETQRRNTRVLYLAVLKRAAEIISASL